MVQKTILSLSLILLGASTAFAQCNCGDCGNAATAPVGSNYMSMDTVYNNMALGGGCDSCSSSSCNGTDCYGLGGTRDCGAFSRCRYLSVFGGANWIESFQQSNIGGNTLDANRGGFDDGFAAGFAVGSQVHPNVRFELETTFRDNDAEDWFVEDFANGVVIASAQNPAVGNLESYTGMVNFLFDLPSRQPGCANFYGGVGIGGVAVNGEIVSAGTTYDVNDSSFAFQAIAGVSKAIRDRVDLYGEYRFLNAQNILVDNVTAGVSLGDFEYTTNSLLFGIRFRK